MKNAGMAGALALVGIGLMTIGLSNFHSTQQAQAAPVVAAVSQGPEEPTIVWYDSADQSWQSTSPSYFRVVIKRAWSDGTIEMRMQKHQYSYATDSCFLDPSIPHCDSGWVVISSPTDGLNAAADINFDEIVNGADLAMLLAQWGDAPRNPMPPSDCPLGLLNPS